MHRLKIIYKKPKRTFKASKNVWWWSVILKFTYKLKIIVEHENIVEHEIMVERPGCGGRHHLGTIMITIILD